MRTERTRPIVAAIVAACLCCGIAFPRQEGPRPLPPELLQGGEDPTAQLRRLFREVETTLRAIDDQLFDAAAGEANPSDASAEIDRLLRETEERSRSAIEGIDRIIEVAQQMQQQSQQQQQSSSNGSGSPSQDGGSSPIDGDRDQERQQRMQGEDAPRPDDGGQPEDGDPREGGERPQPTPDDGAESDRPGANQAGEDPRQEGERGPASNASGADRWGDLPPRVQSIFRNQVGDDLPVRYRDWIDRYHRRLNG
jgi:TolA-binding protein